MLMYDFYRGWHFPSNGAIANVVHRDLDLYYQGNKISVNIKYTIWKTMRTNTKCLSTTTFIEVDICYRMAL